jgi:hypothetical protein
MPEDPLRFHLRRMHGLLQWLTAIALLQLATLGWLTYNLVGQPPRSRSARSTTPTLGGRCHCRALPVPCL